MSVGVFEGHITYLAQFASIIKEDAEKSGFKTSKIDGDPVMGDKVFFYLTAHSDSFETLLMKMKNYIMSQRVKPVRYKIEATLIDVRVPAD